MTTTNLIQPSANRRAEQATTELRAAIAEFNEAQRHRLTLESGLTWLGDTGPVFLAGDVRIRGLAMDGRGQHWCDAELVAESAYGTQPDALDYWQDRIGGDLTPAHELVQWAIWRGQHTGFIAPVDATVGLLELHPARRSNERWARAWECMPHLSDAHYLGILAAGLDAITPGVTAEDATKGR